MIGPENMVLKLAEADAGLATCNIVIECIVLHGLAYYGNKEMRESRLESYQQMCLGLESDQDSE